MSKKLGIRFALLSVILCLASVVGQYGFPSWIASFAAGSPAGTSGDKKSPSRAATADPLEQRFTTRVRPFLQRYCFSCHRGKKPEAELDLSRDATVAAVAKNARHWDLVLARLQAKEMPPEDAPRQPKEDERAAVIAWLRDLRDRETRRNAGDPGTVLARRLSNAEFDYTIRDLTGWTFGRRASFPSIPPMNLVSTTRANLSSCLRRF